MVMIYRTWNDGISGVRRIDSERFPKRPRETASTKDGIEIMPTYGSPAGFGHSRTIITPWRATSAE
jgi:hypothetical protein